MVVSCEHYGSWKTEKLAQGFVKIKKDQHIDLYGDAFTRYQYSKQHTIDTWRISRLFLAIVATLFTAFFALQLSPIQQWFLGKEVCEIDVIKSDIKNSKPTHGSRTTPEKCPEEKISSVNSRENRDKSEKIMNALMTASKSGDKKNLEFLLKKGIVPASVDNNRAIIEASKNGHMDIVRVLLKYKDVVANRVGIQRAYKSAESMGHSEIASILLPHGRQEPQDHLLKISQFMSNSHLMSFLKACGHALPLEKVVIERAVENLTLGASLKSLLESFSKQRGMGLNPMDRRILDKILGRVGLSFQDDIVIVWAAKQGNLKLVDLCLKDPSIDLSKQSKIVMQNACESGSISVVKRLLADPRMDPKANSKALLELAFRRNELDFLKMLLANDRIQFTPQEFAKMLYKACQNYALIDIIRCLLKDRRLDTKVGLDGILVMVYRKSEGFLEYITHFSPHTLFKLLLADKRIDPSEKNNALVIEASIRRDIKLVKKLLEDKRVNPAAMRNEAVREASKRGQTSVVRLLLRQRRVDPSSKDFEAYKEASRCGFKSITELLLKDSRVARWKIRRDAKRKSTRAVVDNDTKREKISNQDDDPLVTVLFTPRESIMVVPLSWVDGFMYMRI